MPDSNLRPDKAAVVDIAELCIISHICIVPVLLAPRSPISIDTSTLELLCQNIFFSCQSLLFVIYALWSRGESWSSIGLIQIEARPLMSKSLCLFTINTAIVLGIMLASAMLFGIPANSRDEKALLALISSSFSRAPFKELCLYITMSIVAGFSEEIIFTGFILGRLARSTRSVVFSIFIVSVVFGVAHSYKSTVGMFVTAVSHAVYCLAFRRWNNLWPLIIAHAATDASVFLAVGVTVPP